MSAKPPRDSVLRSRATARSGERCLGHGAGLILADAEGRGQIGHGPARLGVLDHVEYLHASLPRRVSNWP